MDVFSHGLWGGLVFGRKSKNNFIASALFGMLPDLIPFTPFFIGVVLGYFAHPDFASGDHNIGNIPAFVYLFYSITHSLVIFTLVAIGYWTRKKRFYWPMFAWPLHILMDIPTHVDKFFPTPFLWPLSKVHVSGIAWSDPVIFFPNVILLLILSFSYIINKKITNR